MRALLGYLALAALFYTPILLGLRTFPDGDFNHHFLPFSLFQRSELLAGRLPVWNPYTYAGHPFLADVQAGVFYPVSNMVLGLTLPWDAAGARLYWLEVEAILQVALAGFFTYLLVRALTGRTGPAFLAGIVFAFSGYLTGYPPLQLAVLRTAIWLPLILWLLWRAFEAPSTWRWWIAAAVAYASAFFAGHPQTFLFLSYAVAGWLVLLAWTCGRTPEGGWRVLAPGIAGFYAVFLGLSAAQLLPSAEFTQLSVRASSDYAFLSGGFPLQDTWQMLLPRVLTTFSPLYVGIVPLGLALMGVAAAMLAPQTIRFRPGVFYFSALAALALLLSYGEHGFLYPLFYRFAPGFKLFRGQERAAYLVAFGLSVLGGYGAAALTQLPRDRGRRWTAVYALAAAVGLGVFALAWQRAGRTAVAPAAFGVIAVTALALLGGLTLVAWVGRPARGLAATGWQERALIALTVVDLFLAGFSTNLSAGAPAQKAALPPEAAALAAAAQAQGNANLGLPSRTHNEYRVFDDWGMQAGVEEVWGSSPLRLGRYATLFDGFPQERMWQLTGVGHALTWQQTLSRSSELLAEFPQATDTTYLHRLSELNPRAWVVDQTLFATDETAKRLMAEGAIDLARAAIVAPPIDPQGGGAALPGDGPLAAPGANAVRLARRAPRQLEIDVESQRGGLLVVSENWMPGWRAVTRSSGGGPATRLPVVRANLSFLGIPVEPGQTQITLTYRPASVRLGLAISAITVAALALAWLVRRGGWRGGDFQFARSRGFSRSRSVQRSPGKSRLHAFALLGILLLAFALRVYRLDYQELRGDEALGFFFTQSPVAQLIRDTIALEEPHPVGSYILQKGFWAFAGHSEFALRFISAWFGALSVALIHRLGRGLGFHRPARLLAATLLAASPYVIWHSQDARMYALSMALTLASTVLLVEALRLGRLALWLGYAATCWLALQVHYFAVFVLAAQGLYMLGLALTRSAKPRTLATWIGAQGLAVLCYLPWLIVAGPTLTGYRGNGDSPDFPAMLIRALSVFGVGESVSLAQRPVWAIVAGLLLLIATIRLVSAGAPGRRAGGLLALYFAVPVLATWASALSRPIFNERYLVAAAPPFFLLLTAAVFGYGEEIPETKDSRRLAWAGGLLLALLVLGAAASLGRYYFDPEYSKTRGWRELARVMQAEAAGALPEKTRLIQNYPDPVLWYYTGPTAHLVLPPDEMDESGARREVQALLDAGVERVVLAEQPTETFDDRGIAAAALAGPFSQVASKPVAGWDVQTYVRAPATIASIGVGFENGITLARGALQSEALTPGGLLVIYLDWDGDPAGLTGNEKLTLQVLDEAGTLVAQTDVPFGAADFNGPARPYTVRIPWRLPAGNYRIIAGLYDPARDGAPRVMTTAGADHVELGVMAPR